MGEGQKENAMPEYKAMLAFLRAATAELGVRDTRAIAALMVLVDNNGQSVHGRTGKSVQFVAAELGESTETCRHALQNLAAAGLVCRCGVVDRTILYRVTDTARAKLDAVLSLSESHEI